MEYKQRNMYDLYDILQLTVKVFSGMINQSISYTIEYSGHTVI